MAKLFPQQESPVTAQAVLVITQVGAPPNVSVSFDRHGTGHPRELLDAIIESIRETLENDPSVESVAPNRN